jgi:hypothetical protein
VQPFAGELHESGCFAARGKVAHDWTLAPPAGNTVHGKKEIRNA